MTPPIEACTNKVKLDDMYNRNIQDETKMQKKIEQHTYDELNRHIDANYCTDLSYQREIIVDEENKDSHANPDEDIKQNISVVLQLET